MKTILRNAAMMAVFILCLSCVTASAQTKKERTAWGYGFVSPSGSGSIFLLHFGGGGEGVIYKGLGIGGEIGYVAPVGIFEEGIGLASINGVYVFRKKESKLAPFVTGGYTLAFRDGTLNMINLGGGVNYWFKDRVGLRLEFRDHVAASSGDLHIYGFRVGLTFR